MGKGERAKGERKMKIAITGHIYPVPPFGYGGERATAWWIEELRKEGIR